MKRRPNFNALIAATLITGFALSACGIRGDLKTPPPLWGEDSRSAGQQAKDTADRASKTDIEIQAPESIE